MIRAYLVTALVLSLAACKSKEEQACRSQEKWAAEFAEALGQKPEPMSKEALAECIADQKRDRERFKLDEQGYEALLDCRIAAKTMDDALDCLGPAMKTAMEVQSEELDKQLDAMQERFEQELEAELAKLEAHVASGAVSAETIAHVRAHEGVPVPRATIVVKDALEVIEDGRVAAGNPIRIKLQDGGLGPGSSDLVGLDAAELSFVDSSSGATVGRLAPLTTDHLGSKSDQVDALLNWMLEDPDKRRVEIIVTSPREQGLTFVPPALEKFIPRFEAAGIADRQVIWLDDVPMTVAAWVAR